LKDHTFLITGGLKNHNLSTDG